MRGVHPGSGSWPDRNPSHILNPRHSHVDNADVILSEYESDPQQLDRLFGLVTDLYIDREKLKVRLINERRTSEPYAPAPSPNIGASSSRLGSERARTDAGIAALAQQPRPSSPRRLFC
jgi:hypothetical protein